MAKLELKGIVTQVSPVSTVGQNNTKKQTLILKVPGFRDPFGEQTQPDEEWQLEVVGARVDKIALNDTHVNKKVKCVVWISSRKWTKDDKDMYFISASLGEIEVVGEAAPEPVVPATLPTGGPDGDLPF
jgi:hypothetical protein